MRVSFEERQRRSLQVLYARLRGQLDQRVGREKRILRSYLRALDRRLRAEADPGAKEDHDYA